MHDDSAGALRPSLASFLLALNRASSAAAAGVAGGTTALSAMGTGSVPTVAADYSVAGADAPMTCGSHHHFGMENTSACGVDAVLCVLLRIVAGFRPVDDDGDDDFYRRGRPSSSSSSSPPRDGIARRSGVLRASHERLLFDVIVPLHRPSGMVLWRDQTPLIGLYHETLARTMGAMLSMDRNLVGPAIGALLHPDVWPVGEGGNTPKAVLLLHEVDDLVGLLSGSSSADDAGGERDDEAAYFASFDPHLLPLVSRLCACISSENSRTSERALQFFKNEAFKRLVRRRLDEVGHLFLRALCRCPSMDVPWNPTVRKMTLLVVSNR